MLDRFDLDRYWRIAVPVAAAGCVASLAWAVVLAVAEPPAATVAIDILLFLGIFPLHLGTVVTERRLGGRASNRRRSLGSRLLQESIGWLVLVAFVLGRGVWNGPYADSLFVVVPAVFYGAAAASGRRYRRSTGYVPTPAPPIAPPPGPERQPTGPPAYLVAPPSPPPAHPTVEPTTTPTPEPATGGGGPWAAPVALPRPARQPISDAVGGCVARIVPALVGAVVIFVFVLRGAGTGPVVGPDDRPFYVATIVGGERIATNGIHEEPADPPPALQAAACRNYRDFLGNRTLGTELAIVDDPSLLRSAELLDGAWAGDTVALDAETFLLQEGGVAGARSRMAAEDWPVDAIRRADRYLADRARTPTAGAEDRYVVYSTSQTRTRRLVVRLAIDPAAERVDQPRFNGGVADGIEVALPDGSIVVVDESLCWN